MLPPNNDPKQDAFVAELKRIYDAFTRRKLTEKEFEQTVAAEMWSSGTIKQMGVKTPKPAPAGYEAWFNSGLEDRARSAFNKDMLTYYAHCVYVMHENAARVHWLKHYLKCFDRMGELEAAGTCKTMLLAHGVDIDLEKQSSWDQIENKAAALTGEGR